MHFCVYLFTKKKPTPERIAELLRPYGDGHKWDWYEVGGRWTGHLSNYDPESDPQNQEPCGYCENGITTEAIASKYPAYKPNIGKTCIQCHGTGHRTKWPTEWAPHKGDTQRVGNILHLLTPSQASDTHGPYAYLAEDEEEWRSHEVVNPTWDRKSGNYENYMIEDPHFNRDYTETVQRYLTGYVTVIDCHN